MQFAHAGADDPKNAAEVLVLATLTAQSEQLVAAEALRRQSEALALAAHELRNPLMPIRTVAALLAKGAIPDELPRLGKLLERQVMHMTRLIDDLLDVARVATGKLHLDRHRIDLREVLDDVVEACRPAMDARSQAFAVRLPERPLVLEGDPVRLTQVFVNILNNASKYTPEGGDIALECRVRPIGGGAGEAVVVVRDNGIGITPEALPLIWEPFVQDPLAIGFSKQGLGVGLTLVRELVRAHSGSVSATSAGAGQGSAFVVDLPLA